MPLVFMSPKSVMKAGSIALFLLLSASLGFAAPTPRRHPAGRSCDPHAALRKLPRHHPKSFGGPVALPSKSAQIGLTDVTTLIKRGPRAELSDDDEAIQNDAPAAQIDDDQCPAPGLTPLGILHRSFDIALCTGAFCPRSPRGPPAST